MPPPTFFKDLFYQNTIVTFLDVRSEMMDIISHRYTVWGIYEFLKLSSDDPEHFHFLFLGRLLGRVYLF